MIELPYGEKNYDDMFSRFHLIPERYGRTGGQTDGQTDRFAISISHKITVYRASAYWRAIKTVILFDFVLLWTPLRAPDFWSTLLNPQFDHSKLRSCEDSSLYTTGNCPRNNGHQRCERNSAINKTIKTAINNSTWYTADVDYNVVKHDAVESPFRINHNSDGLSWLMNCLT